MTLGGRVALVKVLPGGANFPLTNLRRGSAMTEQAAS